MFLLYSFCSGLGALTGSSAENMASNKLLNLYLRHLIKLEVWMLLELFYRHKGIKWTAEWSILWYSHKNYEENWKSHERVAICCPVNIWWAEPSTGATRPRQWPIHAVDQRPWKASCTHPRTRLPTVFCRMPAPSGGIKQRLLSWHLL